MASDLQTISERLIDVGIPTDCRFIDVLDGEKRSVENHHEKKNRYSHVYGNYGIYATEEDSLVILDVDDYDGESSEGLEALGRHIPTTLTQKSPHGGRHVLLKVEPVRGDTPPSEALENVIGAKNPKPSWGEVRTANQYVVGAGSQLDGCTKEWCVECSKPERGRYTIYRDVEVASITTNRLIGTLLEDPEISKHTVEEEQPDTVGEVDDEYDLAERVRMARESDPVLDRLMDGDYSDFRDPSSKHGVDRSKAESSLAARIGWWVGNDKSEVRNIMNRYANTKKWDERTDESYRSHVLGAVDANNDCYTTNGGVGCD